MPGERTTRRVELTDADVKEMAITATIDDFRKISGLSRSRIYEMLRAGKLQSVHHMGRHLILVEPYREYIRKLQLSAADGKKDG